MRYAAYIAFFFSGASSLIFQNIWSRMLHHVFGATSVAISSVVTAFMAGLGIGAWIAGKYADRIKHPIITYAIAELFVGLYALVLPFLLDTEGWLTVVNQALRSSLGAGSFTFMVARFAVVLPLLLVPTTLMGTTLPLLARHFVQTEQRAGAAAARVGVLYAINTFGAVAGINLAGFILLPTIGLAMTNVVAMSMNLALGLGILLFRRILLGDAWKPGEPLSFLPAPAAEAPKAKQDEKPKAKDERKAEVDEPEPKAEKADEPKAEKADEPKAEKADEAPAAAKPAEDAGPKRDDSSEERATKTKTKTKKKKLARHEATDPDEGPSPSSELAMPIPNIARWGAYVTFAASGAAALCYEVVWTRALAMTIGSSIYSFALILETFLIGIAGGSALAAALLSRGPTRLGVTAVVSVLLVALASTPWALAEDLVTFLVVTAVFSAPVVVAWAAAFAKARSTAAPELVHTSTGPGLFMLAVPVATALGNYGYHGGRLAPVVAAVVTSIALYLAVMLTLRRYPVLLIAVVQLLIATSTVVNYVYQDEIPYTFASLVTTITDLPEQVGTVQFFMFVTAGLCTLPAAIGMGAMFPLTIRIWSAGGGNIGRDVGVVYAGNTIGSIIGAWLPGFILLPWKGMEWTLRTGIFLNLLLALAMLIVSAADSEPKKKEATDGGPYRKTTPRPPAVPTWHIVTVYILAPVIPALIALIYLGTSGDGLLRWKLSQMTLGVFRVSLAADVLDPESWGEPDIVYYHDGLSTTVSVERWGKHYALKNNGKVDASNGDDMPTQIMVAGYPLTMHRDGPDGLDVAIIGFGSGVTVGATLEFPVRSVDVVELERSIPEASQFFADVNHLEYTLDHFPYVERERLTVFNDDGRNYLASTDRTYDVIMSEPSNPWITGVSDLFTTDHFRITKRALRPGGIYCQWVQLYELSPENIKTIYRTFASVYRNVVVFAAEDLSSDTIILGSDSPLPLDLRRVERAFELPAVREELERAYVHSPFDVFARTILASRREVMEYAQIERWLDDDGNWVAHNESSNGPEDECPARRCVREAVPLNTDDNALIEFAAPRDLIGFQRYEGYLANIYSENWPYARLSDHVTGFGRGPTAARNYAEMAMSLIGHGRKAEAGEFLQQSAELGSVEETIVAAEVLRLLLSDDHEPRISIEPPVPGPHMDERTGLRLAEGFAAVRESIDFGAYGTALAAIEEIPPPLRLHSGPGLRFLYGYLLYKGAAGSPTRYRAAIEQLEDLVRTDEDYVRRHPELYYFLARAHDAEFNYDKALRNMRAYVESRLDTDGSSLPEPPRENAPTTDGPGESPKDVHTDRT